MICKIIFISKFFRTASNVGRQGLNKRRNPSQIFNQTQNNSNRIGSSNISGKSNVRSRSKSYERPKGDLYKKIETMEN